MGKFRINAMCQGKVRIVFGGERFKDVDHVRALHLDLGRGFVIEQPEVLHLRREPTDTRGDVFQ